MSTTTSGHHRGGQRTPVARWEPAADAELLGELPGKLRSWQPLDGEAVLDDVAAALDDIPRADATRHLRRVGWVTNELMECLVAANCLKEVA